LTSRVPNRRRQSGGVEIAAVAADGFVIRDLLDDASPRTGVPRAVTRDVDAKIGRALRMMHNKPRAHRMTLRRYADASRCWPAHQNSAAAPFNDNAIARRSILRTIKLVQISGSSNESWPTFFIPVRADVNKDYGSARRSRGDAIFTVRRLHNCGTACDAGRCYDEPSIRRIESGRFKATWQRVQVQMRFRKMG